MTSEYVKMRREQDAEARRRILDRVKWYIVGEFSDGAAKLEAYVDGEPVYRYRGYYREMTGEWRLYPSCILKSGYELLNGVRSVDIYETHRLDVLLERGGKP